MKTQGVATQDPAMAEREAVEDAWGNSGEEETCMSCDGSGIEYSETCVTCGGLGFTWELYT